MNKNLKKFLLASLAVGAINFSPIIFYENNLQIISVAHAEFQTCVGVDSAMFDFGEDDEKIVSTVKNVAKMRATQAAKEKAGVFVKSYSKTVNGILTDDDISVYTSNNIEVISVTYKKIPYEAHDVSGNSMGKIGFAYEATVTAKIDTKNLSEYINRDAEEKISLIEQNKNSQKNIAEINQNFDDLQKTSENKNSEQIQKEIQKIDERTLAQQKLEEGNKFYYQKNYQSAISKYNEVIKILPNDATAYNNRGNVYYDSKNYSQAMADYTQSAKLNPNYALAYYNIGNIYLQTQNFSQAIENYNKAIQLKFSDPLVYNNRGYAYENLQNYNQALADYNQALKINPNYAPACLNIGNLNFISQNATQAMNWYNKAIQIDPNYPEVYVSRGWLYYKIQDFPHALSDLNKAIELNPNLVMAYVNRGVVYADSQNLSQAISDFTKALQLNPNMANVYQVRGMCYQALGENQKAQDDFSKAKQLGFKG